MNKKDNCCAYSMDSESLKNWFKEAKRDLPWRNEPVSPYAVWVSEVMLQQTRASVVVPYFERWMQRYPTISALATSSREEVIKQWEGLGYYSRARNLHEGAKQVVTAYGGILPNTAEELAKIKGLGPYTIGAILSFAFHQPVPAVDGNVTRVLCRHEAISEDISKAKTGNIIRQRAKELIPEKESWIFNEALIELGATLCGKNPQCALCPLQQTCRGKKEGIASELPKKSQKQTIEPLFRGVAVIQSPAGLLVRRGQEGEIMHDLYEFPFISLTDPFPSPQQIMNHFCQQWPLPLDLMRSLQPQKHTFTRFRASLYPFLFRTHRAVLIAEHEWVDISELKQLAFSSGHRKIAREVEITCH